MKLKFVVGYRTDWGQQLCVVGSSKELGEWDFKKAVPMTPSSGELWELEMEISSRSCEYYYIIKTDGQDEVIKEFGQPRTVEVVKHFEVVYLKDYWRSQHAFENNLLTAPFMKAFFKRENRSSQKITYRKKDSYIRLQLRAPRISEGYQMGVLGSIDSLGNWDDKKADSDLFADE